MRSIALALTLALGACATAHNYPPALVDGQPDTAKFKLYTVVGVPESEADRAITHDLDAYRTAKGYRSYAVLDRRWNYLPTYFEYTVHFDR